jgi:hypothetical protein
MDPYTRTHLPAPTEAGQEIISPPQNTLLQNEVTSEQSRDVGNLNINRKITNAICLIGCLSSIAACANQAISAAKLADEAVYSDAAASQRRDKGNAAGQFLILSMMFGAAGMASRFSVSHLQD